MVRTTVSVVLHWQNLSNPNRRHFLQGIAVELLSDHHDHVAVTVRMWSGIDSEVLLLVFLPGLIFKVRMLRANVDFLSSSKVR